MDKIKHTNHFNKNNLLKINKKDGLTLLFLSLFINLLALTPAIYMIEIYDIFIKEKNQNSFILTTFVAVLAVVLMGLFECYRSRKTHVLSRKLVTNEVTTTNGKNKYLDTFFSDTTTLRGFINSPISTSIFDLIWTPIYLPALIYFHYLFGVFYLFFCFLMIATAKYRSHEGGEKLIKNHAQEAQINKLLDATKGPQSRLQVTHLGKGMNQLWRQAIKSWRVTTQHHEDFAVTTSSLLKFYRMLSQIAVLGCGAYLIIQAIIHPITLLAASIIFNKALSPVDTLCQSWDTTINMLKRYMRRSNDLVSNQVDNSTNENAVTHIEFYDVAVALKQQDSFFLKQLNLSLNAGEALGVIGASGSGKTLVCQLLADQKSPSFGHIRFDNIQHQEIANRREHIGYLPQEFSLHYGTVEEVITGFFHVPRERLVKVVEELGIHNEIMKLPFGYKTPLDAYASSIPTSLKTLIGIACVASSNASVLVFDNPSVALDEVGEQRFHHFINGLKQKGRIVIVTSYKRNLLNNVDKVIVLNSGKVSLQGNLEEVVKGLQPRQAVNE